MEKKEFTTLDEKEKFVEEISDSISNYKTSFCYAILGNNGSGRNYTINKIALNIYKSTEFEVLRFIADQITNLEHEFSTKKYVKSFEANYYLGISISIEEDNSSVINYIINTLKKIKKKKILVVAPDLDLSITGTRIFMQYLIENRKIIENKLRKKIYIITSMQELPQFIKEIELIYFNNYTFEDVKDYIIGNMIKSLGKIKDINDKVKSIYKITNGDIDLVNLIYKDFIYRNNSENESLIEIVNQQIEQISKKGNNQKIDEKYIEEIILTSSLTIECFNQYFLSQITNCNTTTVDNIIDLALKENLYHDYGIHRVDFKSPIVKNILYKRTLEKNSFKVIDIYNYLTKYRLEEYYLRAYYLILHTHVINQNVISLLILAISKAYLLRDFWVIEKVRKLLKEYSYIDYDKIETMINCYETHYSGRYDESLNLLDELKDFGFNNVARAEYNRLMFRNYYLKSTSNIQFLRCLHNLNDCLSNKLVLKLDEGFDLADEVALKLQIIYDICPYILDDKNDYKLFEEKYNQSRQISRQIIDNYRGLSVSEYITNIFNRKAFLYANPIATGVYYDEAKSFFKENEIWDEYVITLICEAGTIISCGDFDKSINNLEIAERLLVEKNITIPNVEKLYNNKYIAEFLKYESENDEQLIYEFAKITIGKLESLLTNVANASNHVILTNLASLYLYINSIESYKQIKKKIECSLKCEDVSDINDIEINDFYRYHFALDEIYYGSLIKDWEYCEKVNNKLKSFIPSLFKKQENIWKYKEEALQEMIDNKKIYSGYDYCNNFVRIRQREKEIVKFYYRGLMLSDLQYTSYN